MINMRKSTLNVLVSCLFMTPAGLALAGGVSLPQILPIQPNLPRPEVPTPNTVIEVPAETPAAPKKSKKSTLKIVVSAFKFSGNQQFSSEILAKQLTTLVGREIGMHELNEAVDKIRGFYRQQGYLLTQVYLPTQDLQSTGASSAVVELAILEGTLGEVKAEAGEGLDAAFMQSLSAYGLNKGDVLNERNLVRNLMVMNGLPGIQVTSQLNPGEAVGSSDVAVSVVARPKYSGYVNANTYGNRFTGREIVGFGLAVNNLNGRGDQLAVVGKVSNGEGQRSISSLYFTPVGDAGTLLSMAYSYVDYKIGREFKSLDASGDAHYVLAALEHPFIRETKKGVALRVAGNYKWLDDDIGAFPLNNRRNIASLEFGLVGDWINGAGNVAYQWSALLTQGDVAFKDSFAKTFDAQNLDTQGRFFKWNINTSRTQNFDNGINWVVRADYQGSNQNLDIAERFGVGAINRWRQYAELPSQADEGWMIGTDVRKPFTIAQETLSKWLQGVTPFAFYDLGRGKLNRDPLTGDNTVKSHHVGLGVDLQLPAQWVLSTSFSQQKRSLEGADSDTESRLWGQLRKNF